jgi:hypothetical protein
MAMPQCHNATMPSVASGLASCHVFPPFPGVLRGQGVAVVSARLLHSSELGCWIRVGYVLDLFVIVRGLPVRHFIGERPLAFAVWPDEHA